MVVYIVDQEEHGNGGVCNHKVLATLHIEEALKKSPHNYGVHSKLWGFWPFISQTLNPPKPIYVWNEDELCWELVDETN
ncbi:hypothetical protein C4588_02125 [Candidatus Parcubacteria bacterium]|nr:MAG: hypothetical protein C4588_02125 [Candidatus Parcubacteria bacterium]